MRKVTPLLVIAALSACTTAAAPPQANLRGQRTLAQWLAGTVAGRPQNCLPNWRQRDMLVADDSTIAFRESPGHIWVERTRSPCDMLSGPGPYALVTRTTSSSLCSGDIGEVVDTMSGTTVGSCSMGEFVPYTRIR